MVCHQVLVLKNPDRGARISHHGCEATAKAILSSGFPLYWNVTPQQAFATNQSVTP